MTQLRSFRLRIALLAALLAGGALIGLGVTSWWLIYNSKVERLDAELENQLMRSARPGMSDWSVLETLVPRALRADSETSVAVQVLELESDHLYRSAHWPSGLELRSGSVQPQSFPSPPRVPPAAGQRRGRPERPPDFPPPRPQIDTRYARSEAWRVGQITSPTARIAIAVRLDAVVQDMSVIRNIFLISIPALLVIVAGGAWILAGQALHPIHRLTQRMRHVTVQGLDQRVSTAATDSELVELIQVFNQMLERLERSFKQASRFSADAAHELKTPLAILQGELERSLQLVESGSEIQQTLSHLLDEVRRLSGITRKLLLLSLADAGQMRLHRVEVNLTLLLLELAEDIELLAPELAVETDVAEHLVVWGDRDLLVQVLQNLLSNAIKYNQPSGWIRIHAYQQAAMVWVTVSNASNPIPPRDRERIFDRFHRGDPARTRKIEGIGLGLSLAREIALAHQGNLTLASSELSQTAFTLSLPVGYDSRSKRV